MEIYPVKSGGSAASGPAFSKFFSLVFIIFLMAIATAVKIWPVIKAWLAKNPEVVIFIVGFAGITVLVVFLVRSLWDKD